ncbi:DivIVA domain-containing protein [Lactobacillus sp. ESL0791]|uniref:DivIVA domain-containing protein n=1 Tax=Lactobacillus sp. ESL0791 TaxID=2983234 RepID=UPI0023F9D075|nr:DivIVA domain-containing protein [Lactobacillus sp. ESL0791]MDF7638911.1 DivIVA domain-containing protein [Lactobacillus sp. ESL0791]
MANLNDVKLSGEDILKKQFKTKVKGFDPDDVDAYLDQVITDYDTFHQIIEDLYGQIGQLQRELMDSKKKLQETEKDDAEMHEEVKTYAPRRSRSEEFPSVSRNNGENSTNMEIIQRISALERKVYKLEKHVYGLQNE